MEKSDDAITENVLTDIKIRNLFKTALKILHSIISQRYKHKHEVNSFKFSINLNLNGLESIIYILLFR